MWHHGRYGISGRLCIDLPLLGRLGFVSPRPNGGPRAVQMSRFRRKSLTHHYLTHTNFSEV